MTLKQYDPRQIIMTMGAIPITGLADGTFCRVEMKEDAFTLQIGSDGEGTRSRSNNNSARITFSTMQSSAANPLLSALHALDKAAPGGAGCVPLLIKDLLGTTVYAAEKAWVIKEPDAEFGREAGPREWVIETENLVPFTGGN